MDAAQTTGTQGRRLYLDAVDEALRRSEDRGPGKRPVRPKRRLGDVASRQMMLVEKQQRALRRILRSSRGAKCETCGHNGTVDPDKLPSIVSASNEITNQVAKLMQAIRNNQKTEREAMGKLTADELKQVFRTQLLRIGNQLDEDERRILISLWYGTDVADVLLRGPTSEVAP